MKPTAFNHVQCWLRRAHSRRVGLAYNMRMALSYSEHVQQR